MNSWILEQEKKLCEEYGCSNIDEVLEKQDEILGIKPRKKDNATDKEEVAPLVTEEGGGANA